MVDVARTGATRNVSIPIGKLSLIGRTTTSGVELRNAGVSIPIGKLSLIGPRRAGHHGE